MSVSRNDHLGKVKSQPSRKVRLPMVKIETVNAQVVVTCSCGWASGSVRRAKVAEDKAQRHLDKHHEGRGLWR